MWKHIIGVLMLAGFFLLQHQTQCCNEAVCGSVVSKCLLTQSCKCDLKNCTCCKECFNCLNHLYSECCSCVDMCPKPNSTDNRLSRNSHVEDFIEKVPALFRSLTESPDLLNRWDTITYPVDYNFTHIGISKEVKLSLQSIEQEVVPMKPNFITLNCTVAFMSQCLSWTKCKEQCQSMGANSYRWFHDACCECVGEHCINYGINESRCRECSLNEEIDLSEDHDEIEDFEGEEDTGISD